MVGMAQFAKRPATELSGGQQQRVALARALVTRPLVMLYDEPLSNLDAGLRALVREQILELHDRLGTSTLYVTHDQSEALSMADSVMVMQRGRVAQAGTPFELYSSPVDSFVAGFLGAANIAPARTREAGAQAAVVTLDEAPHIAIVVANTSRRPAYEAEEGEVAIRPEHFRVVRADPTSPAFSVNTWEGEVTRVRYFGPRLECRVSVGGWTVAVEAPGDLRIGTGEKVLLSVDPERPVWLSGKRSR